MRMPFYRAVLLRGVSHRAIVTAMAGGFDPRGTLFVRAPAPAPEVSDAA